MLIEAMQQLEKVYHSLGRAEIVGVDTEFIRQTTYYPTLALLQLEIDGKAYIVDPLEVKDLSGLANMLATKTLVFHDGQQDLEIFKHCLGVNVESYFDTQLAALFLGYDKPPAYNALSLDYCGVRLSKHLQLSNWMKRPLPQRMLNYARSDVMYLREIAEEQLLLLDKKGYLGFLRAELADLRNSLEFDEIVMRIFSKLCFQIDSYDDAVMLYKLISQREQVAKHTNTRRSILAQDSELIAAVKDYINSDLYLKLSDLPEIEVDLTDRYEFLMKFSKVDWLKHKDEIQAMQDRILQISVDTGISREILGVNRDIKISIIDPERSIFNTSWRKELF